MRYLAFSLIIVLSYPLCGAHAQSSSLEPVSVRERHPDIPIDAPYAGVSNVFGQKLYTADRGTAMGTLGALTSLHCVRERLATYNLDVIIWDFYRPHAVQWMMWEQVPDPTYVADPNYGSNHNRAAAIDVTLRDRTTGVELDMGTGFDDFSESAWHGNRNLPAEVSARRNQLRSDMDYCNFSSYSAEWWHYTHGPTSGVDGAQLHPFQMW